MGRGPYSFGFYNAQVRAQENEEKREEDTPFMDPFYNTKVQW